MKKVMVLFSVICFVGGVAQAQRHALKTNFLYDVTTTLNLGWEIALSPRWSADFSASYNPWTFSNDKKRKHWLLQPELRWWGCEKLNGYYWGVHVHGGQFNLGNLDTSLHFLGTDFRKLKDARYEGWLVGAGVAYGYAWMLAHHWNLEMELGLGYSYSNYDQFVCGRCGEKERSGHHHYFGPTRIALNLVYVF